MAMRRRLADSHYSDITTATYKLLYRGELSMEITRLQLHFQW